MEHGRHSTRDSLVLVQCPRGSVAHWKLSACKRGRANRFV